MRKEVKVEGDNRKFVTTSDFHTKLGGIGTGTEVLESRDSG